MKSPLTPTCPKGQITPVILTFLPYAKVMIPWDNRNFLFPSHKTALPMKLIKDGFLFVLGFDSLLGTSQVLVGGRSMGTFLA